MRQAIAIGWTLVALLAASSVSARTAHKVKVIQYSDDLGAALQIMKDVERRLSARGPLTGAEKRRLAESVRDARQTVKRELALTTLALENCENTAVESATQGNGKIHVNVQLGSPQSLHPTASLSTIEEEEPMPEPIVGPTFQALKSTIENQSFPDDKLGVLQQVVHRELFTVGQVTQLLDLYTFSSDKIDALQMLASRIIDPQNDFLLMNAFVHSSDKEEARRILGANGIVSGSVPH